MADYVTDRFAYMVESRGLDMPITLLVQGVVITGFLAPVSRYADFHAEVQARANIGARTYAARGEVPPPTQAQVDRTRAEWVDRHGELDEDLGAFSFPGLCVRNAVVCTGPREEWRGFPFLLIQADHVSAATAGTTDPVPHGL